MKLLKVLNGFANNTIIPILQRIYTTMAWFNRQYWRQLLLLLLLAVSPLIGGLGMSQLYAGLVWLSILIIVDCIIAYRTMDYWLWPVVRWIETNWYGKPLDKGTWNKKEVKEF